MFWFYGGEDEEGEFGDEEVEDSSNSCSSSYGPKLEIKLVRSELPLELKDATVNVKGQGKDLTKKTDDSGIAFFDLGQGGKYKVKITLNATDKPKFEAITTTEIKVRQKNYTRNVLVKAKAKKILTIIENDHHFAPSKEIFDIEYEIGGYASGDKVELEIISPTYPNNPVYKRVFTTSEKLPGVDTIKWDGKANCTAGPLKDCFINPLYSPYKLQLKASGKSTKQEEFHVYYHSIEVEIGSYTEDGNLPNKNTDLIKWVQYKLNDLGYFAGPVDGVRGNQTRRAIRRYTYGRPGNYLGSKEIDHHGNADFQNQLDQDKGKRELIEGGVLPRSGIKKKIFLDHDYFYTVYSGADFSHAQGHCRKDEQKLDRFEMPLESVVYLVGKDDPNGMGEGILAPEGVGEVDIKWEVKDPPQDTSFLPVTTVYSWMNGTKDVPSKGKNYVDAALAATRNGAAAAPNSEDNCPKTNNKGIRSNPISQADYFKIGNSLPPFTSRMVVADCLVQTHQNKTACPHKIGRSGVIFQGSYIAGDNYQIRVEINIAGHANQVQITQEHQDLAAKSTLTTDDLMTVETGEMTIWRRHHISAIVNWPDPSLNISLSEISAVYKSANCLLEDDHEAFTIGQLFSTLADKNAYLNLVSTHFGWALATMNFDENGLYPKALRDQNWDEDAATYKAYVQGIINTFAANANFQDELAELVYKKVSETRRAGSIILRVNWIRATKVYSIIPIIPVVNVTWPFSWTSFKVPNSCIGLPFGVAFMDNPMCVQEQDGFLFGHEMAHCRYLQHHDGAPGSVALDHDTNDHNCTMSYPDLIASRPGLAWNKKGKEEPRFCGKCILKLRGWDVRDPALPAHS